MKRIFLTLSMMLSAVVVSAQTDVTSIYMTNPDFGARFAGWQNVGSFTFNTATTFEEANGEVWMEKWVASGSKLGTNGGMYQELKNLPAGTYTLVAGAKNINQASTSTTCTGAYIYGSNEKTPFNKAGQYTCTFTTVDGRAKVGVQLTSCTGNWVCVDNFRLFYDGINTDSLDIELDKLITEAESVYAADGNTASDLQAAIDAAKAVKGSTTGEGVVDAAKALKKATLNYRIENATGSTPVVTTNKFVPTGTTIALGRLSVSGSAAERGFCWSTEPDPTILDETSTLYYTNNGNIYHMDGLEPATVYYVRAYARTSNYKVGYGDVVKIVTLPKGQVVYSYDYAGDDQQNARINSASAECVWMYNNLSNIRGFNLQVHYVYGCGAGGGTADCSYGGWMRVSQNTPYQQTGTILHETNHGVGVGTTNEWYNNANLRANTSSGLWLGPRATQMVRFFENSSTATMTGDGTHMWPYGINGAQEDSYNPANYALYFGNIFITHALHQDGLPCSSSVGFATPAYVFSQEDNTKYYIKCESADCGGLTSYLGMTASGTLKNYEMSAEEATSNDDYAWYITYDPKTSYYIFYNIGQQKYITNSSNTIKAMKKASLSATEKFHLMPCREDVTQGKFTGTSYWILTCTGHNALQGGTSFTSSSSSYSTTTASWDASNAATNQRWLFLTADEAVTYETNATSAALDDLDDLLTSVQKTLDTPHKSKVDGVDVSTADNYFEGTISSITAAKESYTSPAQVEEAITMLKDSLLSFLAATTPESIYAPYDLTYLLNNPNFDTDNSGWTQTSGTTSWGNKCLEFFQETYDFNQTISLKLPAGTYEVKAQAFQRPGAYADVYTDYVTNGTDNVKTLLYAKSHTQAIKNICADAQTTSQGTGSVAAGTKCYIPNTMQSAQTYFTKGYYDNSLMFETTSAATMKLGLKCTSSATGYWTCFDNFRLYYYGNYTKEEVVTPVEDILVEETGDNIYYDLSGRRVQNPRRGIYVREGRKVLIK